MVISMDGRTNSLLDSWPEWERKIVEFCKAESETRPAIKKLLQEMDIDHPDIIYSTGILCYTSHNNFVPVYIARYHGEQAHLQCTTNYTELASTYI